MSFPNVKYAGAAQLVQSTNDAAQENRVLGHKLILDDGRIYRFMKAGGTALVVGNVQEGKALVSGDYGTVVVDSATPVGGTTVTVTATTTTAAGYYAGGWLWVNKSAAGVGGYVYRVKTNVLFAAAAGKVITLESTDPARQIIAAADEIGLTPDPYNGVIIATQTTLVQRVVGVAGHPVTADYFGYVQTGGVAAVNATTSALVVGTEAAAVLAAAGRVSIPAAAYVGDATVGHALSVPDAEGEFAGIYLTLDN